MYRRDLLKYLSLASVAPFGFPTLCEAASVSPFEGKVFISIHAMGGWDVSSFCDPKDSARTNHWVGRGTIGQAGRLLYAPFAKAPAFFQKYYQHMLVINGIDYQTNAHTAGVVHSWSGRLAKGHPSFSALYAAAIAPNHPMAFINSGGYDETSGVIAFTKLPAERILQQVARPNLDSSGKAILKQSEIDIVKRYQLERITRQSAPTTLLPREQAALSELLSAKSNTALLESFADNYPVAGADVDANNAMVNQAHLALIAAKSGLTASVNLQVLDFDTHFNHDAVQADRLGKLTDGIDYLWTKAESMGIADRLIVFVSSEFSRTPFYNDKGGKDHWPISSAIFMQKPTAMGTHWGNRVIGKTDISQVASKLNPMTLKVDTNGILLQPKHIQFALRRLAGIESHSLSERFPLGAEAFDFFNPLLNT